MKWKVGDRVSMLSRVNRRRLEPECVRILTVAKVTATQIVLEDGSRYSLDGTAIGKSLGQIRKATPADEAKIADGIQNRRRSAEQMAEVVANFCAFRAANKHAKTDTAAVVRFENGIGSTNLGLYVF